MTCLKQHSKTHVVFKHLRRLFIQNTQKNINWVSIPNSVEQTLTNDSPLQSRQTPNIRPSLGTNENLIKNNH